MYKHNYSNMQKNFVYDCNFFNHYQFNDPISFNDIILHYKKKHEKTFCSNCNEKGHVIKNCNGPITSYGILAFTTTPHPDNYSSLELENLVKDKCKNSYIPPNKRNNIKFLMIQRKQTMAFIDLIRGKYDPNNLSIYFNEMTSNEKKMIKEWTFKEIWNFCWLNKDSKIYLTEYTNASLKYHKLDLQYYLNNCKDEYDFCEFSVPKGRKNVKEKNIDCAKREFFEETGYNSSNYHILFNYPLIEEEFMGTNNIKYKHVYFLARLHDNIPAPKVDINNLVQCCEVSNIGLLSLEECMQLFRPYDTSKKEVLTKVYHDICKLY
jgi:ADP-ribose pyrophosphatase YjhB (NUDIX family)